MYIDNVLFPNKGVHQAKDTLSIDTTSNKEKLLVDLINLFNTGWRSGIVPGEQISSVNGRANANSLFPYDVELYVMILDLVNSSGQSEDLYQLPIMPNSMSQNETYDTSIDKTMSGIVSNVNPSFNPIEISIAGTFGRGLKQIKYITDSTLLNENFQSTNTGWKAQDGSGKYVNLLDHTGSYRTGFGCYKLLEYLIRKSKSIDRFGNPYRLFFYNLALGNNYLVEAVSLVPSQNRETNNMFWNYTLALRAIAPAENVFDTSGDLSKLAAAVSSTRTNQRSNELANKAQQKTTAQNKVKSRVQLFLERQARARFLNLFNINQQSAIIAVTELIENNGQDIWNAKDNVPGEFTLNQFESIINRL